MAGVDSNEVSTSAAEAEARVEKAYAAGRDALARSEAAGEDAAAGLAAAYPLRVAVLQVMAWWHAWHLQAAYHRAVACPLVLALRLAAPCRVLAHQAVPCLVVGAAEHPLEDLHPNMQQRERMAQGSAQS